MNFYPSRNIKSSFEYFYSFLINSIFFQIKHINLTWNFWSSMIYIWLTHSLSRAFFLFTFLLTGYWSEIYQESDNNIKYNSFFEQNKKNQYIFSDHLPIVCERGREISAVVVMTCEASPSCWSSKVSWFIITLPFSVTESFLSSPLSPFFTDSENQLTHLLLCECNCKLRSTDMLFRGRQHYCLELHVLFILPSQLMLSIFPERIFL